MILATSGGIKEPSSRTSRSCSVCSCKKKKKMAAFICPLISSEGLLRSTEGVHGKCVPIHFLKVCCEKKKKFLRWYSPHVGRLHLLFITSWLYFSSKFQVGVQSAKKETLPVDVCVCVCVYTLVLFLFVSMPPPSSLSGITTQILFLPSRNASQYLGIYGRLISAGSRSLCVCVCVCSMALHKAHMPLKEGGGGAGRKGRVMQPLKCSDCITTQINHAA